MAGGTRSKIDRRRCRISAMETGFSWGVSCAFQVKDYRRVELSVPSITQGAAFHEKNLSSQDDDDGVGKFTLAQHIQFLSDHRAIPHEVPLLAFGLRNSLVNLRAPIVWRGRTYAVEGEHPEESRRHYFGLGFSDNKMSIGCALGGSSESWSNFFVAGIPVLWDDADEGSLFELILIEAADHSHVFKLPRGRHPEASDASREAWSQLHDVFRSNVHTARDVAVTAMRRAVDEFGPGLARCDDYLNA